MVDSHQWVHLRLPWATFWGFVNFQFLNCLFETHKRCIIMKEHGFNSQITNINERGHSKGPKCPTGPSINWSWQVPQHLTSALTKYPMAMTINWSKIRSTIQLLTPKMEFLTSYMVDAWPNPPPPSHGFLWSELANPHTLQLVGGLQAPIQPAKPPSTPTTLGIF